MKNVNRMGYRSSQTPDMSSLLSRDHQILKVIVISHFIVFFVLETSHPLALPCQFLSWVSQTLAGDKYHTNKITLTFWIP